MDVPVASALVVRTWVSLEGEVHSFPPNHLRPAPTPRESSTVGLLTLFPEALRVTTPVNGEGPRSRFTPVAAV